MQETPLENIFAFDFIFFFLKKFGPLDINFADRVKDLCITLHKWFHPWVDKDESDSMLYGFPVGTFLLRYSKQQDNAFVLVYVTNDSTIEHLKIECNNGKFLLDSTDGIVHYSLLSQLIAALENMEPKIDKNTLPPKSDFSTALEQSVDSIFNVTKYHPSNGYKKQI